MHRQNLENFRVNIEAGTLVAGAEIDLSNPKHKSPLTHVEAQLIAQLIQHPNCPENLSINLSSNKLRDKGANYIKQALSGNKCKSGLKLNLDKNDISTNLQTEIKGLITANDERIKIAIETQAATDACLAFCETEETNPLVEALPGEVLENIFAFVYPDQQNICKANIFARQVLEFRLFKKVDIAKVDLSVQATPVQNAATIG